MKKQLIIACLIIIIGNTAVVFAQNEDFGLWTSVGTEANIGKRFELNVSIENRIRDNLNRRDKSFLDTRISYRKGLFAAGFGYRISNNNEEEKGHYGYSNRFIWQLRFRPEWKRFSFDYRTRFQSQYFNIYSSEDGCIPEKFFRNRLKASYNIKKSNFEPSASYELYYFLDQRGNDLFKRRRFIAGVEYELNKKNSIELSYVFHKTINVKNPRQNHIISLEYKFEI